MKIRFPVIFALLFVVGCKTSSEFQVGAAAVGPAVSSHALAYAGTDAAKIAAANQLKSDTSVLKSISTDQVAADWLAVKDFYAAGAASEKDANEQKIRGGQGDILTKLIADDLARPMRWFGR